LRRDQARFILLQGGERIMPQMDRQLADYGERVLRGRLGVAIRTRAAVRAIEPDSLDSEVALIVREAVEEGAPRQD
jgi:NADH dehydrogenase FAD-containing subunit